MASSLQLTDPFLHRFPQSQEFGTHESGRRRIDLILVSPAILPCIQRVGYAPFDYSTSSDHRPVLIDLHTQGFLGKYTQPPAPIRRNLQSTDKVAVSTYVQMLFESLAQHGAFSTQAQLEDNTATPAEVEVLDVLIENWRIWQRRNASLDGPNTFREQ